jgi:hypothetical protein
MSTKTKVVVGVAVALVICVVGLILLLRSNLDALVEKAIEHYGSQVAGTQVSVDSVDLSLGDGKGTIRGLKVANPPGFSSADAFELDEITFLLDLGSITANPILLKELLVLAPKVNYERNGEGKGNLDVILENLKGEGKGSSSEGPQEPQGEAKRIRIDRFVFEEGRMKIIAPELKEPFDEDLPAVNLSNVGGENGSTPSQIGAQVMGEFARSAARIAAKRGAEELIKRKLGSDAAEKARGILDSVLK